MRTPIYPNGTIGIITCSADGGEAVGKQVDFAPLLAFLGRVPAIRSIDPEVGPASNDDGAWLVKFQIDITHPAAWMTVMDLGYVANWISIADRLPTVFKPVSVPPD